jgi:carbonic anhydrase
MVKGRAFSMEFQLMHIGRDNNKKLIVAIFADIGFRPPPPVQNMIDHFPPKPGTAAVEFTMNPALLVPEYKGYMTYTGSLTTPPCTEGVKWILLKQKIGITKDQQRAISKLVGRNARLTQPTYFRVVQETREF